MFSDSNKILAEIGYQQQIHQIEDKFRIWANKSFYERRQVFNKVMMLSSFHDDSLSVWVAEQMGQLLVKSEMD